MAGRNQRNQPAPEQMPQRPAQNQVKRKRVRPIGAGKAFALGLLAALIVSLLTAGVIIVYSEMRDQKNSKTTDNAILDQRSYVNDALSNFNLSPSNKVRESVLSTAANITVSYPDDSPKAAQKTNGSGVVFRLSPEGNIAYVMTNYHVIDGAADIIVTISGVSYRAQPVGAGDESSDIAVLRIDNPGTQLPVIDTTRTEAIAPGEWCMTVSNPHGFNDTISVGTISAVGRNIPRSASNTDVLYANMIQTDAAMNPGSSGGGVWDSHGKFLGMICLIWSSNGGNEGIGFAIPKDYALTIAEALVNGQTPAHAVIGASLDAVPADVVASYGLSSSNGAYITAIDRAGAAERATLVAGDIITHIDGKPVQTVDDVILMARGHAVGDQIEITVSRQGKELRFPLTLGSDAA